MALNKKTYEIADWFPEAKVPSRKNSFKLG